MVMYDAAKEKANTAVSAGKYYAVGCKFDPDAAGLQKSLSALEKGVKAAATEYESWAKKCMPLSGALLNHWADTTVMPESAKGELKAAAGAIDGAARARKAFADAVVEEYGVKGEGVIDRAPATILFFAFHISPQTRTKKSRMRTSPQPRPFTNALLRALYTADSAPPPPPRSPRWRRTTRTRWGRGCTSLLF